MLTFVFPVLQVAAVVFLACENFPFIKPPNNCVSHEALFTCPQLSRLQEMYGFFLGLHAVRPMQQALRSSAFRTDKLFMSAG